MTEVFISYARADQAVARRTALALQKAGFEVWWDADLPAHRAYSDVIQKHLEEAAAVVVLWSRLSAKSEWVRAEADFARAQHKLVQAGLDGSLPPMPFNQIQCADLKGWRGSTGHSGWAKLRQSVAALVSGEEEPALAEPSGPRWWSQRRFQLAAAIGAMVLLAALWLVPGWLGSDDGKRPVVAVLPFESLDKRDESLVAGIWEDTRQALSRNPRLLVLGPNTSQQLAENTETAGRAADYLVEASVRSAGDRIRVSANLVRTDDGAQMWSESFERRLDDVFHLQQQIAGEIEGRIRGRLAERGGTLPEHIVTSGEIYALYSDARAKIRGRQMAKYGGAYEQLQEVVRRDPNFAPGWATLSVAKSLGSSTVESAAEADARRAIALAPNLAAGHAALGFALGRKGPAAKAALERALQLDPNDIEAMNWLANAFTLDGNRARAMQLFDRILEIEPLWWPAILNKVNGLTKAGDLASAQREIARLKKLGEHLSATLIEMHVAQSKGDLSTVVNLGMERYRAASPQEKEMVAVLLFQALAQLEMFDVADRMSPPPTPWIPYIRRNDPKALDMFEAEFEPRQFWTFGWLGMVGARVYLINDQAARLARRYHGAADSPEAFMELIGKNQIADYAPIPALALMRTGEAAEAKRLLELAAANVNEGNGTPEDLQVCLARIYAVQGRKDEAIGLLSSAVRRGWIPPYLPIHVDILLDPPLAELKADPRFEQIRQQILGHLAKERAELGSVSLN